MLEWNDQEIADLKAWWLDQSLSCEVIAGRLGTTKNAVIGKARRLRLAYRRPARIVSDALDERSRATDLAQTRFRMLAPVVPFEAPQPDVAAGKVAFADLTSRSCRFIPGNPDGVRTLYCGDPTVLGKSYCQHHLALCWGRGTDSERSATRLSGRMAA